MPKLEKNTARNALTAIILYELSRLDSLPLPTQFLIASELTAAIQTLRMSQAYADNTFHESQAGHYSLLKREALDKRNQSVNQVSFAIASIMHCIHKAYEIDGLQNELISTTIDWVRKILVDSQS